MQNHTVAPLTPPQTELSTGVPPDSLDTLDNTTLELALSRRKTKDHNERCQSKINTKESRSSQILTRASEIIGETQRIDVQMSTNQNQIDSLQAQVDSLKSNNSRLQTNKNRLQTESQSLQFENEQIQKELTHLRSQIIPEGQLFSNLPQSVPVPLPTQVSIGFGSSGLDALQNPFAHNPFSNPHSGVVRNPFAATQPNPIGTGATTNVKKVQSRRVHLSNGIKYKY